MDTLHSVLDIFLHLNLYLATLAQSYGAWIYLLLFVVIFAETGLIVVPFLPGDSLLFAAGSLAAVSHFNINLLAGLLIIAAFLGNLLNYSVGRWIGLRLFQQEHLRFFKKKYLLQAHEFYDKHGGKAIIIGRFLPIIRTFVPFVAGLGNMQTKKFMLYNLVGAIAWICLFLYTSYFFGNLPPVKEHFSVIVLVIIGISILPTLIEVWRQKYFAKQNGASKL